MIAALAPFLALLGRSWRLLAPALPWIAVAVLGAFLWHLTPVWGPGAQLARLESERATWEKAAVDWRRAAEGWESSFRSSETKRGEERSTAQAAANSLIQQCGARVAEARASARVIEHIVTREPVYDESRCPVRSRVDPGLLRGALVPDARPD